MAFRRFALLLVVGALSCAALGSVDPDAMGGVVRQVTATPYTPSTSFGTQVEGAWVFVSGSLDGRPIKRGSSDDVITLDVFPLRVGGFDGCRGFGGSRAGTVPVFTVVTMGMEDEGCGALQETNGDLFLNALQSVTRAERDAPLLRLTGEDAELIFDRS